MSVIIRLQNLPLSAISIDIRNFFRGLSIPDGGVHIVGGPEGDAFIAFSTDEDARQAMQLTGQKLKDLPVRLLLSSRNEMFKVIEQARVGTTTGPSTSTPSAPLVRGGPNSPSSPPSQVPNTIPPNSSATGSFPSVTPSSMLGLGMAMNGSNNFLNTTHGNIPPAMSNNSLGNFPSGIPPPGANPHSHVVGPTDQQMLSGNPHSQFGMPSGNTSSHFGMPSGNTSSQFGMSSGNHSQFGMPSGNTPPQFGIPSGNTPSQFGMSSGNGSSQFGTQERMAQMAGMGMPFPPMMTNPGGMSSGMNSGSMGMVIPPPMMNLNSQVPVSFPPPRGMGMNNGAHMNMGGNNPMSSNMNQSPSMNAIRPGVFSGINPGFLSGAGMGKSPFTNPPRAAIPPSIRGRNAGLGSPMRPMEHGRPDFNRDLNVKDRSRSSSMERRERDNTRRRRSRSRDRDRGDKRRRSRSRSRSPKGRLLSRRDSRDKDDRRSKGASPEKGRRRDSRDSDPPPNAYNMTEEEHPAVKLSGISSDTSFREIKDFLRVEIMGGGDGTVRLYDENLAYVKLEKPSDFPRAYRSNGKRLRNTVVSMEGIPIERWVNEYKANKSRMERDVDIRDRERDRDKDKGRDRDDRGSDRERSDRSTRTSRFNTAAQSSYIVIRNLPPTITSRDVSFRLLKDSAMIDMIVSPGPSAGGRHTAVAHVKLDSPQAAQQAIDLVVRSQDGSHLVVEMSSLEEFDRAKSKDCIGRPEPDPKPTGDTMSIFELESGLDDESCSVMLKGAPPNVSERDVFDFFSDIGLIPMNVKIMYDTNGTCNGQIICEFVDPHKARRATTKDGMLFGRGHVTVELMPSGRKRMLDPGMYMKGGPRPSLLGPRPGGGPHPRFGVPNGPNPFMQAMQGNGLRPPNPRGRGPHISRFSLRNDFGGPNGVDRDERMGVGRGRGGRIPASDTSGAVGTMNFGKQGCVLALENVPFKASMDDILHHLSSILKLDISRERIIRRFDDSEKPTGDARVAWDTPAEAKLAHDRLIGTKMWNRLISYTIV